VTSLFLVAAEVSGDHLGASLLGALKRQSPALRFRGIGGPAMTGEGFASLFPMSELAVFGFASVIARLPRLRARLRETVEAILREPPSAVILIDSYGFSARVARRVRAARPDIPIIKYVSPQVWAWRPGRARKMRAFFDHILALFPFEPAVHRDLGGPECTYVGHPLMERLEALRPGGEDARRREASPPLVLVMPGSRRSELAHLAGIFGEAIAELSRRHGDAEFVLPALPHLASEVEAAIACWKVKPRLVFGEDEKFRAMRGARLAIVASGTASLELALARVPHVGAYRLRAWEAFLLRRFIRISNALLPNILLARTVVPELLQENCTSGAIVQEASALWTDESARQRQTDAFLELDAILQTGGAPPSQRAAAAVLKIVAKRESMQGWPFGDNRLTISP
jgi:lipid-A-disaccharide synthase